MKRYLFFLSILLLPALCGAQREQDFASTYMRLNAEGTGLDCRTVSPVMMSKMMRIEEIGSNSEAVRTLQNLKSVRVVTDADSDDTDALYDKAVSLLDANKNRYRLYDEYEGKSLYVRKRGKVIVELILLTKNEGRLHIVNFTGTMTEAFVKTLTQM
ncbi:MAG: DUF4252 domain-containing protein [Alloprevotella sp.]|nr:DUF4252 domain-containing protein [Alloprevotella sp.]